MNETNGNGALKLSVIKLRNILGLEEYEFSPAESGMTLITGANRVGKSSILEAIAAVLVGRGATDATLIRKGAEEGESVILLDDDTRIRQRVTPDGKCTVAVTIPEHGRIGSPGTYLDKLLGDAFDLVEFIRTKPEKRIEALVRAFPVALPEDFEFLAAAAGLSAAEVEKARKAHALEALAAVEDRAFRERTAVNRVAEDKRRTARELRASALDGVDEPEKVRAEMEELRERADEARESFRTLRDGIGEDERKKLAAVDAAEKAELDKAVQVAAKALQETTGDLDKRIAEVETMLAGLKRQRLEAEAKNKSERDAELKAIQQKHKESRAAIAKAAQEAEAKVDQDERSKLADLRVAEAKCQERAAAAERARTTRELVERTEREAEETEKRARALTATVERARDARKELLDHIPIEGLTVEHGEVCLAGVPFGRLSGAEKVRTAFKIAMHRLGRLRAVLADGIESLDEEQRAALADEAKAADVQLLATCVSEGPLSVK